MTLRLHWTCWQPTPYNDLLFEKLARLPDLGLLVHFREMVLTSHPWQSALAQGYASRVFQPRGGIDWTLVRLAARERYATFVFGGWDTVTTSVALLVLMLRGVPYLVWTDTPDMAARRGPLKRVLRRWWLKRVFEHASFVMGTGAPALAALRAMGCEPVKLRNLPYFVDLQALVPPAAADPTVKLAYLSSGRLHRDKGYDVALRALARVHSKDRQFSYSIAGIGPERAALERLADELGIRDCVHFLGWLEPAAMVDFYRSGQIFLHPARREPYGVVVLEAMAAGLAVVASDATAAAVDRITDGMNGYLHASDDHGAIARSLRRAISDPPGLARMRAAARATAEEWPVDRGVTTVREALSITAAALSSSAMLSSS